MTAQPPSKPPRHAAHFLDARISQFTSLPASLTARPFCCPLRCRVVRALVYEGPEFLDCLVRKACAGQKVLTLITPQEYLRRHPTNQVASSGRFKLGRGRLLARLAE